MRPVGKEEINTLCLMIELDFMVYFEDLIGCKTCYDVLLDDLRCDGQIDFKAVMHTAECLPELSWDLFYVSVTRKDTFVIA